MTVQTAINHSMMNDSPLARSMSMHHGLTDLLDKSCFALLPTVYSCMVPDNLSSYRLATGQSYYQTAIDAVVATVLSAYDSYRFSAVSTITPCDVS